MLHRMAVAILVSALGACPSAPREPPAPAGPPVVYTTFYPTTYFAERIAGDRARVVCPVPDDADPIFWMPDIATLQGFQKADLVVINGADFEKWVARVSLPPSRTVDSAAPLRDRLLRFDEGVSHSHGAVGAHVHKGIDGHTWLDPLHAKVQAEQILAGLVRLMPQHEAEFRGRLTALHADLDQLHAAWQDLAKGYRGHALLASHPAYNYLAARYGWNVINLDLDPQEALSDEQITAIRQRMATSPARHLLWESDPLPATRERLAAELALQSVVLSPCELLGPDERQAGLDYLSVMRRNIEALRPVFAGQASP